MNDFKVGDEVWWFEFPEQCIGLMRDVILKSSTVCETHDDKYIGVTARHSLHRFDIDLYHSKTEALIAMRNRLAEIENE